MLIIISDQLEFFVLPIIKATKIFNIQENKIEISPTFLKNKIQILHLPTLLTYRLEEFWVKRLHALFYYTYNTQNNKVLEKQ